MPFEVKYGHNIPSKDIAHIIKLFNIELAYPSFMDYIEVKYNGKKIVVCSQLNFNLDDSNDLWFVDSDVLDESDKQLPNIHTFNCMNVDEIFEQLSKIHAETIIADLSCRHLENLIESINNSFI